MFQRLKSWVLRSLPIKTIRQALGSYPISTASGIAVNEATAIKYGALYASIRVISETRGSLPMHVYEVSKSGKRSIVTEHPVSQLLAAEPMPDMTPMVWSEVLTSHVLSWGNSYCEAVWDDWGELVQMIPRHPSLVTPFRAKDGQLMYDVQPDDLSGRSRALDRSQMLHVPGLGGNGIIGWSPIRLAAASLGIGIAQDQMAGAYFGNKAKPGLVLSVNGALTDPQFARLKQELDSQYQNENAFRALLLEGGMTANNVSIPMNEAQLLESREFQGEEIACRWFRLPPHVVGYLRRATFSNIEQQDLYFEKHTMRPWLVRFEQEMNRKLFSRKDWGRFYVKHNVDALLRADLKTRYEAHKSAILAGWKSRNEVRELEDLDPLPGLDELPLPEAIFGKGKGSDKPEKTKSGRAGRRKAERRLAALTTQVLEGLLHREVTAVERAAGRSEYRDQVTRFYEKHIELIAERLQPLECDPAPAIAAAVARRDSILTLDGSVAVEQAKSWDVGNVTSKLLGS